ncbi:MAG: hypothetical protein RR478_00910 [Bacilli bacterium]
MNTILSIDPGNVLSAYCLIDVKTYKPIEFGKIDNFELLDKMKTLKYDFLAIEMVACYGMAVGKTVFETCVWIGRYIQSKSCKEYEYVYRKDEKINICNSMKAKDGNIRQSLIDRFGIVGTKANNGFFYGFKADIWSAFAVGITYLDKIYMKREK